MDMLINYVGLLVKHVEQKISWMLQDRFAPMFFCWTNARTCYANRFLTYPAGIDCGFECVCVAFSPLENEESQSAAKPINLIHFLLQLFGKSSSNVVALISDNCAVKKSVPKLLSCNFMGCASHRWNLASNDVIAMHIDVIEKIKTVIGKLCFPVRCLKPRKFTDLALGKSIYKLWSFTNAMLTSLSISGPICQSCKSGRSKNFYPHAARTVTLTSSCNR